RKQAYIDVAKRYYINDESQEDIARSTGMSRSNVSRILKKCVEDGVVEITVHDVISEKPLSARKLQLMFGLKNVIIVPNGSSANSLSRNIGERLAMYLGSILKDNMLVGVSRGRACYYTGRCLSNKRNIRADVIQLQGSVSSLTSTDEGSLLVSLYASKLNGKGYIMNAPLMVKSKRTREDLVNGDMLKPVMKKFLELDIAIFEIEHPRLHVSDYSKQEWLSRADILQLTEVGVVASVCGHYFNENGVSCSVGINDRVIAISPNLLRSINYSIGIAAGKHSLAATLSILKSGLVNVLVVDEDLAARLELSQPDIQVI
ncbi:MAG: MarR family transcriptional regulator, partial [Clostridia bacterium]|nr:MarR family transcriptional regulator [Clostridia bacterium]